MRRGNVTRRSFVAGSLATTLATASWPLAAGATAGQLRAATGHADLGLPGKAETPIWGYDAQAPGPTLRLKQGGRLVRRLVNELPQPTTVHWHGIRIANAMDGVPGLTQALVEPGSEFLYDFEVPDAGTYWYHPHNRTWEQLARGLYGALIVEEPEPPRVDRDQVLMIDDWRVTKDGRLHEESFGAIRDRAHGGRLGNWVTVNGEGDYATTVRSGERLRFRLINTANGRIFDLGLKGMRGWVVALDGQPLAAPRELDRVTLAPAQRADLIVDVIATEGGEAFLFAAVGDERVAIGTFRVDGTKRPVSPEPPPPLAANPVPPLGDLKGAVRVTLRMEGGAMGGLQSAVYKGRKLGMRELVAEGQVWAFNGTADMPEAPLVRAALGQTVRINMVNDTAWPHAMHLHGHHFRHIRAGQAPGPLRDTLLVDADQSAEIAFVADNPGKWLFHCHMVEHAASGMMTWIEVAG